MLINDINTISGQTPVEYGASSVKKLYNDNYSDLATTKSTHFLTNKNGSTPFKKVNGSLISSKGEKAYAITRSRICKGGNSHNVYFGKNAFSSKEQLAFTLTHELGHVTHNH